MNEKVHVSLSPICGIWYRSYCAKSTSHDVPFVL